MAAAANAAANAAATAEGGAVPDLDKLKISSDIGKSSPLALMVMFGLALLLAAAVLAYNHWPPPHQRRAGPGGMLAMGVGGEVAGGSLCVCVCGWVDVWVCVWVMRGSLG